MSGYDLDGPPPEAQLEDLLPSRTTEQIVASLVAVNPRHTTTLAQRLAQMTALLKRDAEPDDYQRVYELRVEQIGGDPDEMMPGNRPRYTMDEDTYAIKDHHTGEIHQVAADVKPIDIREDDSTAVGIVGDAAEAKSQSAAEPAVQGGANQIEREHSWPY